MAKHDADPVLRQLVRAVDGWTLQAGDATEEDKGPFARLLGTA